MKTALVTIAIGEKFQGLYDRYARERFEHYARRHGYDLRVITAVVREIPGKKLTWQKLCLGDLPWYRDYDRIACLDSDILIAHDAPALPDVPPGFVGCALDKGPFQINSGVLIYRPGPDIVALFEEALKDPDPFWDQKALTDVLRAHARYHLIDPHFHRMVYVRCWSVWGSVFGRHWMYHALHGKRKLEWIERLLKWQRR
jgi:hypothetical protein